MPIGWPTRLALGLALGAVWQASRAYGAAPLPGLVHWPLARATALALCRRDGAAPERAVAAAYERRVATSAQLVERYVGQPVPEPIASVHALSRAAWVEANLIGLRQLVEPLNDVRRNGAAPSTLGNHTMSGTVQLLLSVQLGLLLGFLARRVLGQYDLALLGSEPVVQGRLYFVEPNIAALEERFGLPPEDFRMWIALHETTHAFEFEAHPWLREHLADLLRRYLRALGPEVLALTPGHGGFWTLAARVAANALRSQYAIEVVMSPEQREIFRSLQATMAVLEGYSNHVMNQVGAKLFATYADMRARFERRLTERTLLERVIQRITGLSVKLEQYALGEQFIDAIVARAGIASANRIFSSPATLPTLDELRAPEQWLVRALGAKR